MRTTKKLFSVTLCLIMVLCMLPIGASAANTEHHLVLADDFINRGSWSIRSKANLGGSDAVFGGTILDGLKTQKASSQRAAIHSITIENAGTFRVWVRAMIHNNTASGKNTWEFEVDVDNTTLEPVFGGGGAAKQTYVWQDGGTLDLTAGKHTISIADRYADYAKFNGILITNDTAMTPSDNIDTFQSQIGITINNEISSGLDANATTYMVLPQGFSKLGSWTLVEDNVAIDNQSLIGSKSGVEGTGSDAEAILTQVPAGTYRVWVHARELPNNSSLNHAWQFQMKVNTKKLPGSFGGGGRSIPEIAYFWSDAGTVNLKDGTNSVCLVDTWCNYAKCDAVLITSDLSGFPTDVSISELKNSSIIVDNQYHEDSMSDFVITDDYAGGNIRVISQKDDRVCLDNNVDPNPGSDPWFYWSFQATSDTARTVSFEFNEVKTHSSGYVPDLIGNKKVLCSTDGGLTWTYIRANSERAFNFTFEAGQTVRFCNVLPYVLSNYQRFVDENNGKANVEFTTLREKAEKLGISGSFVSEEGRDMPLAVIGNQNAAKCVVFTARNHACETVGSYTLEGILQFMMEESNEAFLQEYCIYAVPMVDIDGVENGEQGKGRRGQESTLDHNRDYGIGYYPETVAVTTFFTELFKEKTLAAFIDCHAPGAIADKNGNYLSMPKTDGTNPNGTAALETIMAPKADRYADILNSLEDGDPNIDKLTYDPSYAWRAYGAPGQARIWFAQFEPQLSVTIETSFTATPSDHTPENIHRWGWTVGQAARLFLTTDEKPAKNVVALINGIGKVTPDKETAIQNAREAYDALTEDQKLLVSNYSKLESAEKAIASLLGKSSKTKNDSNAVLWIILSVVAVALLAAGAVLIFLKKHKSAKTEANSDESTGK